MWATNWRNHENLKIFPKICIQTFSVIAIIVLFIHLFVYLIFPRTYLDVRKEEIYTKANEITENLMVNRKTILNKL